MRLINKWISVFSICLSVVLLLINDVEAQWKEGFNFRDTLAYCTDPTDSQILCYTSGVGCDSPYPTTAGGVTFGATNNTGDNKRDRDNAVDCRLAGISFQENNAVTQNIVQVDLPAAGNYKFRLAMGDPTGGDVNYRAQVYDNTTLLATINDASCASGAFVDATGVERTSAADWVSNNAEATYTFATTTAFVKWGHGDGSTSGNTFMSHFQFEQVPASDTKAKLSTLGVGK